MGEMAMRRIEQGPEFGSPELSPLGVVLELVAGYTALAELGPIDKGAVSRDLDYRRAEGSITEEQVQEVLYRLGLYQSGN